MTNVRREVFSFGGNNYIALHTSENKGLYYTSTVYGPVRNLNKSINSVALGGEEAPTIKDENTIRDLTAFLLDRPRLETKEVLFE